MSKELLSAFIELLQKSPMLALIIVFGSVSIGAGASTALNDADTEQITQLEYKIDAIAVQLEYTNKQLESMQLYMNDNMYTQLEAQKDQRYYELKLLQFKEEIQP